MSSFRFIDLYAGIGGFRIPFDELGGECVFTSEIDKYARMTYEANHKNTENHILATDIRPYAQNPELVPSHDLLLAGFPCQAFSILSVPRKNILNKPHGFADKERGVAFFDIARILQYHYPKVFILENVPHLKSHDNGATFTTILSILTKELGYDVYYRIIDSSSWVPQRRKRLFIIGFRDEVFFDFNFDNLSIPYQKQGPILGDILESVVDCRYTLKSNTWKSIKNRAEKHNKLRHKDKNVFDFKYYVFNSTDKANTLLHCYRPNKYNSAAILIKQEGSIPRVLTPRECSRLMGFDEPRGTAFKIVVSDRQAYRQFGNAVVVPVVRALAELVYPYLIPDA